MTAITEMRLDKIHRNPNQPRDMFPEEHIQRLAASIKKRGLIQPITVRPDPRGDYQIVAGECRYRAHQLLKTKTIKAIVEAMDDSEMQLRSIVENLQRLDMNPMEEARAFKALVDHGFSPGRIVGELGLKSTAIVTQRLVLLNLTPEIQKLVACGQMPVAMAFGIAQVSKERQPDILRGINSGKLKTAEQVRHAGIALRDAEAQTNAFDDEPKASKKDVATLNKFEAKIDDIAAMVAAGFKDGECVAAKRASPDRVRNMADKLALIRKHCLDMEHDLRCGAAQGDILQFRKAS